MSVPLPWVFRCCGWCHQITDADKGVFFLQVILTHTLVEWNHTIQHNEWSSEDVSTQQTFLNWNWEGNKCVSLNLQDWNILNYSKLNAMILISKCFLNTCIHWAVNPHRRPHRTISAMCMYTASQLKAGMGHNTCSSQTHYLSVLPPAVMGQISVTLVWCNHTSHHTGATWPEWHISSKSLVCGTDHVWT